MFKSAFFSAIALLTISLSACGGDSTPGNASNSLLDRVKSRGRVVCGVSGEIPGFSFVDTDGKYSGLDVDVCRAIAAALFDQPDAVDYRNLNAKERFTAVQTREVDILSRNTTLTISRDTSVGMAFGPIVFYDGQGIMVGKNSNIKFLKDLKDKAICTQTGTTNEQNLADKMRQLGITYKSVVFEDINTAFATYQQGRWQDANLDTRQLFYFSESNQQISAKLNSDSLIKVERLTDQVREEQVGFYPAGKINVQADASQLARIFKWQLDPNRSKTSFAPTIEPLIVEKPIYKTLVAFGL